MTSIAYRASSLSIEFAPTATRWISSFCREAPEFRNPIRASNGVIGKKVLAIASGRRALSRPSRRLWRSYQMSKRGCRAKARNQRCWSCCSSGSKRDDPATPSQATAWKEHSVRGVMSGAPQKRFGLVIVSEKVEGRGRVYWASRRLRLGDCLIRPSVRLSVRACRGQIGRRQARIPIRSRNCRCCLP